MIKKCKYEKGYFFITFIHFTPFLKIYILPQKNAGHQEKHKK